MLIYNGFLATPNLKKNIMEYNKKIKEIMIKSSENLPVAQK